MQLGARWTVGAPPHRSVPAVLHEVIVEVEAEAGRPNASWTLTWLEGRPRLSLEGELRLTLDGSGDPVHVAPGSASPLAHALPTIDEDDDDWLG
ncbi:MULTISPECIES: Fe-S oxidoreductase [unclassified Leucobacter]|uniref:Fe-S oxidoreductase n=1 Tax=unclassified Leucobacter TaxID=2621730 RepID=UPI00165EBA6F|nr:MULTISPECIES: Fe-S oxidoreductase [unclassified Leucobacter]MBC9935337.1 Fe-S oxidoreductase [Leucobacter sp. cx-87]